jgi:hypothetical protein
MDDQITNLESIKPPIDCACVIHGDVYSWTYVERLYNMLSRHISQGIRFHVYTENDRPVPAPMIKHALPNWNISGPRSGWWYKMKLFDSTMHAGPLLYFDLDVVIVNNIDWICKLPSQFFWSVRDFKYLWKSNHYSVNSSIMWWDTSQFDYVWKQFEQQNLPALTKKYRGDQDYIGQAVQNNQLRFLDSERIKSWRWQCLGGGYNFKRKNYLKSNSETVLEPNTDILVFHGQPKPADIADSVIDQHWR